MAPDVPRPDAASRDTRVDAVSPSTRRDATPSSGADAAAVDARVTPDAASRRRGIRLTPAGRIDVDVYRVDVRKLLRRLAEISGANLILFEDVRGAATVQLRGVPAHRVIEIVADAIGCETRRSGRMIVVRRRAKN